MVRKYLFLASMAIGLTAMAAQKERAERSDVLYGIATHKVSDFVKSEKVRINDGSVANRAAKVGSTSVEWKRPAGQFWGTGYLPEVNGGFYARTPLQLRPWVEYTFENISSAGGVGTWTVMNWNSETGEFEDWTSKDETITASYLLHEAVNTPRLAYRGQVTYPTQFSGEKETYNEADGIGYIPVYPECDMTINTIEYGSGLKMAVSSHYWGVFTRNATEGGGLIRYSGARGYEGMEDVESDGLWFGTNAQGYNASATRFEKPDMPYLLNEVVWYYIYNSDIPKEIPLKAYVFKTVDDAKPYTYINSRDEEVTVETLEVGELLAVAEAVVPVTVKGNEEEIESNCVRFAFKEKNPVTGAENAYSLEIEDDITIIVVGYDVDLGNGGWISSLMSTDEFDEGYGNLGFLGRLEETEDGAISYDMRAISDFFVNPTPKTVLGVLADVSYPWITPPPSLGIPSEIKLPNEGVTTETELGLQVGLTLLSSSMTEDYEITYNGEEECDWFELVGLDDEMEINEDGDEEFAGFTYVDFEAAPNPTDENRTVTVKISIPAASYEITFLQGSNNNAVEIVGVDSKAEYFDLQGRRVVNPDKGIYIKKTANKAEKVIL